jgi:hypothetical protein
MLKVKFAFITRIQIANNVMFPNQAPFPWERVGDWIKVKSWKTEVRSPKTEVKRIKFPSGEGLGVCKIC